MSSFFDPYHQHQYRRRSQMGAPMIVSTRNSGNGVAPTSRSLHRCAIEAAIDLIVVFAMSHAVGVLRVLLSSLRAHRARPHRRCHRSRRCRDGIYASSALPHPRAMRIASTTMRVRQQLRNATTIVINDACLAFAAAPAPTAPEGAIRAIDRNDNVDDNAQSAPTVFWKIHAALDAGGD